MCRHIQHQTLLLNVFIKSKICSRPININMHADTVAKILLLCNKVIKIYAAAIRALLVQALRQPFRAYITLLLFNIITNCVPAELYVIVLAPSKPIIRSIKKNAIHQPFKHATTKSSKL